MKTLTTILLSLIFLNVWKAQNEKVDTFVLGNEYVTLELTSAFWDTFYPPCDFDATIHLGSNLKFYPHIILTNFDTTQVIITYADTSLQINKVDIGWFNVVMDTWYDKSIKWKYGYENEGRLLDDRKKPIDPKYIILDYKPLKWKTK